MMMRRRDFPKVSMVARYCFEGRIQNTRIPCDIRKLDPSCDNKLYKRGTDTKDMSRYNWNTIGVGNNDTSMSMEQSSFPNMAKIGRKHVAWEMGNHFATDPWMAWE
mmetsp:Transcript_29977/g.62644  ORF Transcript_29977/g.62644 Transcript_29977/m.62644 type:complete len:106 (+) Transcript_29977:317-634(+)